jgi:hypothetical protein
MHAAASDRELKALTTTVVSAAFEAGKATSKLLLIEDLKINKVPKNEIMKLEADERSFKNELATSLKSLKSAKAALEKNIGENSPISHYAHLQAVARYEALCEHAMMSWSHAIKAKSLTPKEGPARSAADAACEAAKIFALECLKSGFYIPEEHKINE